jgi:formylglycine-generating enzyme required for sulfatase activity
MRTGRNEGRFLPLAVLLSLVAGFLGAAPVVAGGFTDPVTGMEFVCVQGGTFERRDTSWGQGEEASPAQPVTVSDFCIGKTEVTYAQWNKVMDLRGYYDGYRETPDRPVEDVSWYEVQDFIRRLGQKSGREYRLPTEAEWEYAARSGGKKETWAGTSDPAELPEYAWYRSPVEKWPTHPVGQKKPNGLGLYDMSGNVWEWVQDWYGDYPSGAQRDPRGPFWGSRRVIRGGWGRDGAWYLRAEYRGGRAPTFRHDSLGFRLAADP